MHMRLFQSHARHDAVEDALGLWQERIAPFLGDQPGFVSATLAADRSAGKGVTMTFWNTQADALAFDRHLQESGLLGLFTPFWNAPPTVEMLEVVRQV